MREGTKCTLRGPLNKAGSIDFQAPLFHKVLPDHLEHFRPQGDVLLHALPPHVEIAVFESCFFPNILLLVYFEWRSYCFIEHLQLIHKHLNFSCRVLFPLRSFEALTDFPSDLQHPFRTHFLGYGKGFLILRVNHHLREAVAVPKVDENEPAMIAAAVDPAAESRLLSLVTCTEFAAGVSTEHGGRKGGCRKYAVSVCRIPAFFRALLPLATGAVVCDACSVFLCIGVEIGKWGLI